MSFCIQKWKTAVPVFSGKTKQRNKQTREKKKNLVISQTASDTSAVMTHHHISFDQPKQDDSLPAFKRTHILSRCNNSNRIFFMSKHNRAHESQSFFFSFSFFCAKSLLGMMHWMATRSLVYGSVLLPMNAAFLYKQVITFAVWRPTSRTQWNSEYSNTFVTIKLLHLNILTCLETMWTSPVSKSIEHTSLGASSSGCVLSGCDWTDIVFTRGRRQHLCEW